METINKKLEAHREYNRKHKDITITGATILVDDNKVQKRYILPGKKVVTIEVMKRGYTKI